MGTPHDPPRTPPPLVASLAAELRRYRALAEAALAQVDDACFAAPGPGGTNALVVIVQHVAGNLASRFTDFLSTDGEKPWRRRDEEFVAGSATRGELMLDWERAWCRALDEIETLGEAQLFALVTIRGQGLPVHAALHRALAHVAYHVGQIVQRARAETGDAWRSLSIPPGGSQAYAAAPDRERPDDHAQRLGREPHSPPI